MLLQHKGLAQGGWRAFTLPEQLGNVGSEIDRAIRWEHKDKNIYEGAIDRALELMDLTIQDSRWSRRLKEILRARECICDARDGGKEYGSSLEALNQYFLEFALAARSC